MFEGDCGAGSVAGGGARTLVSNCVGETFLSRLLCFLTPGCLRSLDLVRGYKESLGKTSSSESCEVILKEVLIAETDGVALILGRGERHVLWSVCTEGIHVDENIKLSSSYP